MTIYEDRSGIIWVGTFGGGLNKFSKHAKRIRHYYNEINNINSLSSNNVYCFCEDSENALWIGTRGNGISKFDRKKNLFTHYNCNQNDIISLSNDIIMSMIEDDDKNIWIATSGGGLNKFEKETNKFIRYKNEKGNENSLGTDTIFSMAKDKSGIIWIGTVGNGLNKFDPVKKKFTRYSHDIYNEKGISSNRVRAILIDRNGIIWIGTDNGGLNKFNKEDETFYHYKSIAGDNSSISDDSILSIFEDSRGIIWVGTMSCGLNKFDKEKNKFKRYSQKDGLPNDSINGIVEDDHYNLWISTNNGISKFNPMKETFKNYDVRDGFQSNEFNQCAYIKLKSGELAFGGINGFNIFNPEDIMDNTFIPPVIISDFLIFNKEVPIALNGSPLKKTITLEKEIVLSYRESVFSFEFASLDFNIPGKNQYAYKMEGFDKEWVYSGNRGFATYTNLNPAEYVFRVKGSNNDGIWNEEGTDLKITITPPFWKTWWFRALGVLAVAGTAGSIYQNKLNRVIKEKKAHEEFTKRLIDVQENDRKRIGAELHDSVGPDLVITKNKLLMSLKKPDDKEFILNNINEASDILTDTLKGIREISYTMHPYQIERLGLAKAIQSIIDRTIKSTELNFVSNIDLIDKILKPDVEISLYRILQESINNIVKHSKATEVILNISKDDRNISIFISDNGIGFNPEKVKANSDKHGFGLFGMSERVKLFQGEWNIHSEINKGTTIRINIPVKQDLN